VMNKKVQTPMPFALPVSLRPFHRVTGLDHWAASPPASPAAPSACLPASPKGKGAVLFSPPVLAAAWPFSSVSPCDDGHSPPRTKRLFFSAAFRCRQIARYKGDFRLAK